MSTWVILQNGQLHTPGLSKTEAEEFISFFGEKEFQAINLNKEYRIVFKPKNPELFEGRRRFYIGAGQIDKYLGQDNKQIAITKAFGSVEDVYTKKFRAHGAISFYRK